MPKSDSPLNNGGNPQQAQSTSKPQQPIPQPVSQQPTPQPVSQQPQPTPQSPQKKTDGASDRENFKRELNGFSEALAQNERRMRELNDRYDAQVSVMSDMAEALNALGEQLNKLNTATNQRGASPFDGGLYRPNEEKDMLDNLDEIVKQVRSFRKTQEAGQDRAKALHDPWSIK